MNIYLSTETNFENNGLGFLTDCISAYVDESLNGDYVLNITYPLNGKLSEYLVEDNVIKTNVGNDNYQLFRIARVNKDFNEIEVYALHISYDLLTNMLVDTYPQNLSCEAFGNWLFNHTQYQTPFTFQSDISTSKSARYVRRNPIEAIMGDIDNSMVNIFGGEVERDNFTFKLLQNRGQNNHVKLMIGKNITEIKTKVDITSMFTRIMPIGYDGLLLPEKFIDSPLINNYPSPRITKVEFSDIKYDPESEEEGVYTNIEDAYEALRNATQALFALGIDKPQITINIDWLELSKTEQYKNQYQALETVRLGDTITAAILDFDYTTKVVKTTYNVLTDSIEKFEIGTIQKTIANTINQSQNEIQKIQPDSILDEARTNATNLINNALGGYIYLDYETGNLYIMDTDNPSTAQKVWRWNLNGLGYSSTGINGTYGIAMTMDGQIVADYITAGSLNTNVIKGYGSLTAQVQANKDDIATIKAEISDIADITTSATDTEAFIESSELQNIASSYPIRVEIHPIDDNISYLYPSTNTFPSDLLFPKIRDLKFINTSTNEVFTYTLPQNLLYYDSENYDTFVADYETETVTITKKCGWNPNGDGSVILLDEPVITTYSFIETFGVHFNLTKGNYQVELPGYNKGYIMVRLMVLNAYTEQYATKVELNSAITLTSESILGQVSQSYATKQQAVDLDAKIDLTAKQLLTEVSETYATQDTTNQLSTRIKQNAKTINMTATDNVDSVGLKIALYNEDGTKIDEKNANIEMSGMVLFRDLSTAGATTINGGNITTGSINCNRLNGGTIQGQNISGGNMSGTTIKGGSLTLDSTDNTNWKLRINRVDDPSKYLVSSGSTFRMMTNDTIKVALIGNLSTGIVGVADTSGNQCQMTSGGVSQSSDIRYKTNIKEIDKKKSMKLITNLNPISYELEGIDGKHRGLSAQEVEKVMIQTNQKNQIYSIDKNGRYSLNYTELIPDLINCIKYQQEEIETLKKEINQLKGGK